MGTQTQLFTPDHRPGGSAVAVLRRATRTPHRRLERQIGVMSPDLTIAAYRTLLIGFASLHQTLDHEIAAWLQDAPAEARAELDVPSRRRMPLLARDLGKLGVVLPAPAPFALRSRPGALGALYVSEGATLGGSTIAPHVRAVLGPDTPVDFFSPPGVDVVARWATCRRVIDRLLVTPDEVQEAAGVATAVFERFAEVLCR